jgi:hypothetical protein
MLRFNGETVHGLVDEVQSSRHHVHLAHPTLYGALELAAAHVAELTAAGLDPQLSPSGKIERGDETWYQIIVSYWICALDGVVDITYHRRTPSRGSAAEAKAVAS